MFGMDVGTVLVRSPEKDQHISLSYLHTEVMSSNFCYVKKREKASEDPTNLSNSLTDHPIIKPTN